MDPQFTILTSFMYATDGHVLVAKLESEGIHCFLDDENLTAAQPFLSNAIGGIKLKVRQEDVERAQAVLKTFEEDKKILEAQQQMQFGTDYKKVYEFCPQCESGEVYRKKGFSFGAREHICAECKHTWKK